MYERAQAKEQVARGAAPPSLSDLRLAATVYERIVRNYPTSGYADNALWQAAGLLGLAYEKSGDTEDRAKAERWLEWLKSEYRSSPLAKKVDAELRRLTAPAGSKDPASTSSKDPASTPLPASPTIQKASVRTSQAPQDTSGPAFIRSVTSSALPNGQRIAIEFSREVQFSGERVENPDRVFFDFKNSAMPGSILERAQAITGTFIKSVRIGHPSETTTRIVLDLKGRPRYSSFSFYDPFRLVIDVVDTQAPLAPRPSATPPRSSVSNPARGDNKTTTPPPAAPPATAPAAASRTSSGEYSLPRQLGLGVSKIVIDAGHGGHDPGAIANGVTEAELVLDIAQRLGRLLTETGAFQVVLTRDTDEFIALEDRTAVVKRESADLFLSIHANASPDPGTRGVETYFLNIAGSQAEAAVAARENASSTQTMSMMPELTRAILLNNKLKESREFATIVQTSMMRRMSQQNKALRDLGVKQAPFRVLIGAQMPSVLAEISFLTNKNEASLLKQGSFRQRIAQALYDGIVGYQGSLKKVTTVAARAPQR
jgi:N-acetylmuramoyl-L-alanine amidase